MKTFVSASVLGCDLSKLGEEILRAQLAGADMIHFDVMDGHFVDNISFGAPVLSCITKSTDMFMDVHLMLTNPLKYIRSFAEAGADMITFHCECADNIDKTIEEIKSYGLKVGLSIKPSTPLVRIRHYLEKVDMVLIMTVEPGFGGQGFIYNCVDKISDLHSYLKHHKLPVMIQVDGGINGKTATIVREAGAGNLVSGSFLFGAEHMEEAVRALRGE